VCLTMSNESVSTPVVVVSARGGFATLTLRLILDRRIESASIEREEAPMLAATTVTGGGSLLLFSLATRSAKSRSSASCQASTFRRRVSALITSRRSRAAELTRSTTCKARVFAVMTGKPRRKIRSL